MLYGPIHSYHILPSGVLYGPIHSYHILPSGVLYGPIHSYHILPSGVLYGPIHSYHILPSGVLYGPIHSYHILPSGIIPCNKQLMDTEPVMVSITLCLATGLFCEHIFEQYNVHANPMHVVNINMINNEIYITCTT